MRKLILFSVLIFVMQSAFTQTPERMSYQAVIRNSNGQLVAAMPVGMRISILEGSVAGFPVYVETQTPVSNANGLISIEIGNGTIVSGDFALIDWANGLYFLRTETDPSGGTNYSIVGTSQLLSVPYAFHAKTAESLTIPPTESDPVFNSSVASGISSADTSNWNNKLDSYTEIDPVFNSSVASSISSADTTNWNNKLDSYTESDPMFNSSVASGISSADTTNWNNKLDSYTETDPVFNSSVASGISNADTTNWNSKLDYEVDGSVTNELQALSISNDTIYLVNGGFVKLPTGFSGDYNDLSNTPTIPTLPTSVSAFTNDAGYLTEEMDGSVTNELQIISISNDTIYLSSGGFAVLPAGFSGDYNDLTNKPNYVDWDTIASDDFDGQYSSLSGVPTNISSFNNDTGYITGFNELDGDSTNELQELSISNDTIFLSDGGYVILPLVTQNSSLSIKRIGFESSAVWTCPTDVTVITVQLWGASGGGGGGDYVYFVNNSQYGCSNGSGGVRGGNGGDGGNGGYLKAIVNVTPGLTYNISIGIGGNGGAKGYYGTPQTQHVNAGNGSAGTASSFNTTLVAQGGSGGSAGSSALYWQCTNGADGSDAAIINYSIEQIEIPNTASPRTYIPEGITTIKTSVGSYAIGGVKGLGGTCSAVNNNYSDGNAGSKGENGYCIISY